MRVFGYLTAVRSLSLPVATGVAAILLGAASVHADSGNGGHGQATAFGMPGSTSKVTRTITVTATDMKYSITSLTVKVGETIRFVVVNKGESDHDFTIGDAATQKAHRAEMAKMMEHGTMDHGAGGMHHDDSFAAFVKPGETKSFIWTFAQPGTFEFACNVPGHSEAGMKGKIMVTAASKK